MKKITVILLLTSCFFSSAFGQLFVADQVQSEIWKFTQPGPGTVFVPDTQTPFNTTGVAFGPDGNLYAVGTGQNAGQVFRFNGSTGASMPGPNAPPNGSAQFTAGQGFSGAQALTFGPDGNIYVAGGNTVSQYNGTSGDFMQAFTLVGNQANPGFQGITVGTGGFLYVSDGNPSPSDPYHDSILKLNVNPLPNENPFTTFVASNTDDLQQPTGLAFGPDGNLYVASPVGLHNDGNGFNPTGEVRRFSGTTGLFMDKFVSPGSGNLNFPKGLIFGPDGNLYVASYFHNPPSGNDPGTDSFVARYNGLTGAYIDNFAQGGSDNGFFGIAFPTFAAIPETRTTVIGGVISLALVVHFISRKRNRSAA